MTFLQDKLSLCEIKIGLAAYSALSLLLTPLAAKVANSGGIAVLLGCALLFAALLLIVCKFRENFITIDETGIRCCRSEVQLWSYLWSEILELQPGNHCRHPAVEIITSKSPVICGYRLPSGHYFQLGKEAKIALATYCDAEKREKIRQIR